jgi:rod shape-determining protein MreC
VPPPAYDRKVVRRRRAVLVSLIGVSLVLLTIYFGESAGGGLHAIQRGAQEALAPIETGVSKALKPFRDLVGWTGDVLDAKGDNEKLKEEVTRLRRELARAQTERRDLEQLGALRAIHRSDGFPQGVDPVTARVIARSPTVWYSTVQINKGSSDGVAVNQPVITGDGLVGKVTSVSSGSARVTLITDASSAVSAQIVPDGASGVVKPEVGDPDDLLLEYIQKGRRIGPGATIVTSGFRAGRLESLFPRGIPIGKVKRVDSDEVELYQRVHVEPFADLRRMDYVQVLTRRPQTETATVVTP